MKEKLYQISPSFIQNLMISLFNYLAYKKRYGGKYKYFRKLFKESGNLSLDELKKNQSDKKNEFLKYVLNKSPFYKELYIQNSNSFPIVSKEDMHERFAC